MNYFHISLMRIRKLSYESKPFLPNTSIQRSSNRFCTDSGSFFFPSPILPPVSLTFPTENSGASSGIPICFFTLFLTKWSSNFVLCFRMYSNDPRRHISFKSALAMKSSPMSFATFLITPAKSSFISSKHTINTLSGCFSANWNQSMFHSQYCPLCEAPANMASQNVSARISSGSIPQYAGKN